MATEITPSPQPVPQKSAMRWVTIIARFILGLIFLVFGLNGFLHFIPTPEMPEHIAAFMGAMAKTGYMFPLIFATQIAGGALVLLGLFVPLGLALLAPVIVHIVAFHLYMDRHGLPMAIAVAVLELYLAWAYRGAFGPMLHPFAKPTR